MSRPIDPSTHITRCRQCGRDIERRLSGVNDYGSKLWEDPKGRRWRGHTCPDCFSALRKAAREALPPLPRDQLRLLLTPGKRVRHAVHGLGYVRVVTKTTFSIQFDHPVGYKEFRMDFAKPEHFTPAEPLR